MSISNNKSEITNTTQNEVNMRSITSEGAPSERHVRSLVKSIPRRMKSVVETQGFWTSY
jgi:hypothetical protein